MNRPRVLLADDHTIVAEGLERMLGDEFELVGSVRDGAALVEAAGRLNPAVIVADISMPVKNGLDAMRELRRQGSQAMIVVLTMHADPHLAAAAFRAGAAAYLLKHSAGDELIAAVHAVLRGGTYVTPVIAGDLHAALADPESHPPTRSMRLTRRQREVLGLIAEGRTMKEIAAALKLSARTVESHKYQMIETLGLRTTADLVRYAVQMGLVSDAPALDPPRPNPPRSSDRRAADGHDDAGTPDPSPA
jgi:DNA-binding NarL/FixJ family response regulator